MKASAIISSSTTATTAMSAFSYIISGRGRKDFREPFLLNKLLHRWGLKKSVSKPAGWIAHYSVGALFSLVQKYLADRRMLPAGASTGAGYGLVCGFFGCLVWELTLNLHHNPPKINRRQFYLQLLPAHIIFGLVSGAVLRFREKEAAQQTT
jgi:hypothetical protein